MFQVLQGRLVDGVNPVNVDRYVGFRVVMVKLSCLPWNFDAVGN